jgi:hypothetical protein
MSRSTTQMLRDARAGRGAIVTAAWMIALLATALLASPARAALEIEPLSDLPTAEALESLTFSPDGRHVAGVTPFTEASTPRIAIFDLDGTTLTPMPGSPFAAAAARQPLLYSPDGTLLVTNVQNNQTSSPVATVVYRIAPDGAVGPIAGSVPPGERMAFSSDGKLLAVAARNSVSVYSVSPTGELNLSGSGVVGDEPGGVAFSTDSTMLAVAQTRPSQVYSFTVSPGGALAALPASPAPLPDHFEPSGMATTPLDGRLVIGTGSRSSFGVGFAMYVIDHTGALIERPAGHHRFGTVTGSGIPANPPSLSAAGDVVAGVSARDPALAVYSLTPGGPLVPAIGSPMDVSAVSVAVAPSGSLLAAMTYDEVPQLWLLSTAKPPTVRCDPAPDGWQPADATLSCTASDGGSGLGDPSQATFSLSTNVAAGAEDGDAATNAVTVCDVAGNCTTVRVEHIKIDRNAPALSCEAPDAAWHPANVSLACHAVDPASGLADPSHESFSLSTSVPAGGVDAGASTGSVNVCDAAGNCAVAGPVSGIKIDRSRPTVAITSPTEGQAIARNGVVAAQYACADEAAGSGVATCAGAVAAGQPLDTSTLGPKTFGVTATDGAGNTDTKTVAYTVVDVTAPTISAATPGPDTDYAVGATILADYSCADEAGGSGLASCTGTVPSGQPIDTSNGSHVFTINAADNAGNTSSATINYTGSDRVAPQISISSPMGSYGLLRVILAPPRASFACTDNVGGSGLASCTATADGRPVANGGSVPAGLGRHTFSVTAIDGAGNKSTETTTYTITLL